MCVGIYIIVALFGNAVFCITNGNWTTQKKNYTQISCTSWLISFMYIFLLNMAFVAVCNINILCWLVECCKLSVDSLMFYCYFLFCYERCCSTIYPIWWTFFCCCCCCLLINLLKLYLLILIEKVYCFFFFIVRFHHKLYGRM